VTYSAAAPSLSLPGDPRDLYASWSGLLFIWMPLIVAIAPFILALRLRKTMNLKDIEERAGAAIAEGKV